MNIIIENIAEKNEPYLFRIAIINKITSINNNPNQKPDPNNNSSHTAIHQHQDNLDRF